VVAIDSELSPVIGVGACGFPLNVGDCNDSNNESCTNSVVAIFWELSPSSGVGDCGDPEKIGDAKTA
jgi:hypothetical protein